jgi:hypothetical protein
MKLDMSRAWNDALRLLASNRQVILIVAGVFFFLPYLALSMLAPELANPMAGAAPGQVQSPEAMMTMFTGPVIAGMVGIGLLQAAGTIALLAMLTDHARPTLAEALGTGVKALLPYIGTMLLQGLLIALVVALPLGAAIASGSGAATAVVGVAAFVGFVYVYVKFSLAVPVIAIDRLFNPVAVLRRSWVLTKGNSLRLLGFYMLLFIAVVVISAIAGIVVGLPLALVGGGAATFGSALIGALTNTAMVIVFMGVLAAVHQQLSGTPSEALGEVFD